VTRIGIVGGTGPESTIDYYRLLLDGLRQRPGAAGTGILIDSVDLARLMELLARDDRDGVAALLAESVQRLARGGATIASLTANTLHIVFDAVQRQATIPLVSIVVATCERAQAMGLKRVGLLGTRFTMRGDFYPAVFAPRGIEVVVPAAADLEFVHDKYMTELLVGRFLDPTRDAILAVVERMRAEHAVEGVILGGTELPLLLRGVTAPVPFLDTTRIHVDALLAAALG